MWGAGAVKGHHILDSLQLRVANAALKCLLQRSSRPLLLRPTKVRLKNQTDRGSFDALGLLLLQNLHPSVAGQGALNSVSAAPVLIHF